MKIATGLKKLSAVLCVCAAVCVWGAPVPLEGPEVWLEVMGGNFRKDGLKQDLEAIKEAGFSGVHFFHIDRGGAWPGCPEQIPCLSEKWDDIIRFMGDECRRLGLALTVQNCPGWSQSGGPWITLENCMREAVYARRDFKGGEKVTLPEIPGKYRDRDSDWKDIALLAFPTPEGDTGEELKPVKTEKRGDERIYRFAEPVTIRSMVLPGIHTWNNTYGYHMPWIRVSLEAKADEGWEDAVRTPLPVGSWRDYVYTFTLACDERTSAEWRYKVEHDFPLKRFGEPKFYSAARQTDWESKSALVLRSLMREQPPMQGGATRVKRSSIVDITGKKDWKVPPGGNWTVIRVAHVNSKRTNGPAPKEATGWECDKLDPAGIEANFRGYVGRLLSGPLKDRMYGLMVDSWECFGQTWTPKMEKYFREANGYELRRMLPAVFGWVIDDYETTEKFLTDWRRTLGNLITRNYYGRMAALARDVGLTSYYETAFGDIIHGDLLEYWKYADAPMCEFWFPHKTRDEGSVCTYAYKPVRPCASAAHIYGKKRVVAEAFTGWGIRWDEDFKRLQDVANRHFARGVTHLAYQSYTHSPDPEQLPPGGCMGGFNGTPFTRLQTWWKHMREFNAYITRAEKFLEAGVIAQDVLWYLGDAVDHKPDEDFAFPEGYRADYLNHDVLTNRLSVKNGRFTIPEGASWAVLWVPDEYRMLPKTKARLEELAAAGGRVVRDDKAALAAALSEMGLKRDVETFPALGDEPSEDFMWIHRKVGDSDRYFVAAGTNGYRGKVTFRAYGEASIFDPVSCERRGWKNGDELVIAPSRSVFVEFGVNAVPRRPEPAPVKTVPIENVTLQFPKKKIALDRMAPWSDLPGLSRAERAFAGEAVYEASFDYDPADGRLELDLGDVESVAEVHLNGCKVAVLWCKPYSADITRWARPGRNELKIFVVNTWRNKVIYDLSLPVQERETWMLYQPNYNPGPNDPFVPSGIVGPVKLTVLAADSAAEFITPAGQPPEGRNVAVFRREFAPRGKVLSAVWSVTALGVFEAFVNGRPVGEDFLKPGVTECGKARHVYSYDVTGLIDGEGGTNVLSATVSPGWWCDAINRFNSKRPQPWQLGREVAFRGELKIRYADGTAETVGTDTGYLAAYSGPLVQAGIYEGEVYDARSAVTGLKPARINREFNGELRPASARIRLREDLEMKPKQMYTFAGAEGATAEAYGTAKILRRFRDGETVRLRPGETLIVDFGQNASAVPSMEVEGAAGTVVTLRHSEMLNEANGEKSRGNDGPARSAYLANLRSAFAGIRYTLKSGRQTYRPAHSFFGYRYLSVTATGEVKFIRFSSLPVSSITKDMEKGRLVTGLRRVNRLISNIRFGMLSNYLSIPTDCPQRDERLGWTADTQVFMDSAAYLADTYPFLSKYLDDLNDSQFADGLYPCFAPNARHVFTHWASCGWTDAGVMIPYRLWKRYGRLDCVKKHWDSMVRYMDFLENRFNPYRINHCDWLAYEHYLDKERKLRDPRQNDITNAYFEIWVNALMREMASALGRGGDERRFAARERVLREAFRAKFIGKDGAVKDVYRGQCTDLYALKLNLVENGSAREIMKRDLIENIQHHGNRLQTGFLGTAILMPTLTFEADAPELAYTLLLQDQNPSWLYSVDQGATTVWERWNSYTKADGFGPVGMNSFNHYAYGCVLEWLYSAAAGIRADPDKPGFRHFILNPHPDRRLGFIEAEYDSPAGLIRSSWRYSADGSLVWKFTVPEGTSATVIPPGGTAREYGPGDYEIAGSAQ